MDTSMFTTKLLVRTSSPRPGMVVPPSHMVGSEKSPLRVAYLRAISHQRSEVYDRAGGACEDHGEALPVLPRPGVEGRCPLPGRVGQVGPLRGDEPDDLFAVEAQLASGVEARGGPGDGEDLVGADPLDRLAQPRGEDDRAG